MNQKDKIEMKNKNKGENCYLKLSYKIVILPSYYYDLFSDFPI